MSSDDSQGVQGGEVVDLSWQVAEMAAIKADPGRSLALALSEYCDMLVHVHHPMAQLLTARLLEMVEQFKIARGGHGF